MIQLADKVLVQRAHAIACSLWQQTVWQWHHMSKRKCMLTCALNMLILFNSHPLIPSTDKDRLINITHGLITSRLQVLSELKHATIIHQG